MIVSDINHLRSNAVRLWRAGKLTDEVLADMLEIDPQIVTAFAVEPKPLAHPILKHPFVAAILATAHEIAGKARRGPMSVEEIAAATGYKPNTVIWAVGHLRRAGIWPHGRVARGGKPTKTRATRTTNTRSKDAWIAIEMLREQHGRLPSARELAEFLSISPSPAAHHIRAFKNHQLNGQSV